LSVIILLVLEVIFFIFTDSFLGILASGYKGGTSGDKELLIKLTRILLLNAPFMMMAGQMNGILNSYKRFAIAAFGPVIYNICTIISISIFGAKSAELTAWGVVAGGGVFFIIQFSGAFRHFVYYQPKLFLKSNAFSKLMRQAIPSLISSTIIEVNVIISRSYATFYESGMVTLLNNANRTWQLPLGIFAQSIGIALLPTLSEQYAKEKPDEFKRVLYNGLKTIFLLSLITSVIMMILSDDIMRALFKWGDSGSEYDVFYGGLCLLGYSATLVFSSTIAMMTRAFYSIHNSKTPLYGGVFGIVILYLLNAVFRKYTNIGIAGTALAYSISAFFIMMAYLLTFRKKTGIDIITDNFGYIVKALMAAVPAGMITFGLKLLVRPDVESKLSQILALCVPTACGLGLYWLILLKLKTPEITYINNLVLSRLKIGKRRTHPIKK